MAEEGVWVASMVAQSGYGPSARPRIRYSALRSALGAVRELALELGATVHVPLIGTGEAGGDWDMVEELIRDECVRQGVAVTVYVLPDAPIPTAEQTSFSLFDD